MAYKIGISSGWWSVARAPELLGLTMKVGGFGATTGIQFNQIDLDTISEFLEPRLKQELARMKKELSLEVGLHGEIGEVMKLESAERRFWELSHQRLVTTAKHSADLKFVYVNFHFSNSLQLYQMENQLRYFGHQYQVVGPDGEPLWKLCDTCPKAKEFAKWNLPTYMIQDDVTFRQMVENVRKRYEPAKKRRKAEEIEKFRKDPVYKTIPEEKRREIEGDKLYEIDVEFEKRVEYETHNRDFFYEAWKKSESTKFYINAGEINAYIITAIVMHETGDPLWKKIVGNMDPQKAYIEKQPEFNAAVAARYLEGHLKARHEWNSKLLNNMTMLDWLKGNDVVILFECPQSQREHEGLSRLYNPLHGYHFIKKVGSKKVMMTIDFEHMLGQGLDPEKEIPAYPNDFGSTIFLFHLGEPKPYWGEAHIPIPIGSQSQEVIYKWLYQIMKKGFSDGYMIFERGGGRSGGKSTYEVFEHSVWVLRQFANYLEKDVKPDDLPPEFFGISEQNKDTFTRQLVAVRDHAWDPLEGVLMIPEEKHGFFSKAAVEKGKREEWEKRKYR